jgi:hypothetical protein
MPVGWRSIDVTLTLSCSVRLIGTSIKRSESRRGHGSVREHNGRRKRMSEVVRKRQGGPSGHVLLRIDGLVRFECIDVLY